MKLILNEMTVLEMAVKFACFNDIVVVERSRLLLLLLLLFDNYSVCRAQRSTKRRIFAENQRIRCIHQ